jgi:hypothetical protein
LVLGFAVVVAAANVPGVAAPPTAAGATTKARTTPGRLWKKYPLSPKARTPAPQSPSANSQREVHSPAARADSARRGSNGDSSAFDERTLALLVLLAASGIGVVALLAAVRPRMAIGRTFAATIGSARAVGGAATRAATRARPAADFWTQAAWFVLAVLLAVAIGLLAVVLTSGGMP